VGELVVKVSVLTNEVSPPLLLELPPPELELELLLDVPLF